MTNTIGSIMSNRPNALQATANPPKDPDQYITVTVAVVDDKTLKGVPDVPVYWGSSGSGGAIRFFDSAYQQFSPNTQSTTTGPDGTTFLYVCSSKLCIAQIVASLSRGALAEPAKKRRDIDGDGWVGTTIAIWTINSRPGVEPEPTISEENAVKIQYPTSNILPSPSTNASAFITDNFSSDAQYVAVLVPSADAGQLGTALIIDDYDGPTLTIQVPYAEMATGPSTSNQLAYMIYASQQGYPSRIYKFTATGTAMKRPDDENHTPDGNLLPAIYVEPDSKPPILDTNNPPGLLTSQDYDLSNNINFVIPDYDNPDIGVRRNDNDVIVVTAYLDAWKHGSVTPKTLQYTVATLAGSDFGKLSGNTGKYAEFFMQQQDLQGLCPYGDNPNLVGWFWLQYVINNQHYSNSFTCRINFC